MKKTSPSRGLIIREPWISHILNGSKTWELRGRHTAVRGRIGLIAAGSGVVAGESDLIDVIGPIDRERLSRSFLHHRVDTDWRNEPLPYRSIYAWVLRDAFRYSSPRSYSHPVGAVIWVKLDGRG